MFLNRVFTYTFLRKFAVFLTGVFCCIGRWDGAFFPKSITTAGVAILFGIMLLLSLRDKKIFCINFLKWYGLFYAFLLISLLYTPNHIDADFVVRRCFFIFIMGLCVSQLTINDEFTFLFFKSCRIGAIVTAIVALIVDKNLIGLGRIGGSVCGAPTTFAVTILVGFWCSLILLFLTKKKMYLLEIIFFFVVIVLSGSRMPLCMSFVSTLIFYFIFGKNFFQKFRRFFLLCFFSVFALWSILNIQVLYDNVGYRIETMIIALGNEKKINEDSSLEQRAEMKSAAIKLWKKSPWIGYGVHSFWIVSPVHIDHATSHCGFTEILFSFGIIGFILFYGYWALILFKNFKKLLNARFKNNFLFLYSIMIFMLFVMDWQTDSFTTSSSICFLLVLFILSARQRRK